MHTKIMVVDGAAALAGSSNVTEDLQRSRQIDLSRWQRRSAPQRTLETAVTAIRRWL
jgi:hypothetical protein